MTSQFSNFLLKGLGLMIVFSLILSPAIGMAKENDNKGKDKNKIKASKVINKDIREGRDDRRDDDNDDNDDDAKIRNSNSSNCLKAFGHLIAPGWIKKNGVPETDPNCVLPFGISKKLFRQATTTKPIDTTAPVISGITARAGANFAIITWNTNERTTSKLFWSSTTPIDLNNSNVINSNFKSTFHFALITSLSASTTYHSVITAKDIAGNTATSSEFHFTTGGGTVVIVDTTAPIISATSTTVGTSTINVSWLTNEPATSKVYYSTTTPISTSTDNFVSNSSLVTNHSLGIGSLSTSTLYYLLIESRDASGNTATSSPFATTTLSN
ncbi:MAG: hypothetical protein A2653_01595 [Candidatus Zambryskibacteria bacterium RIFCSPHIGHO2_01_FULL_43_25]|uniref:Fibronectin type-III domain-containing protein n=1 Tax=Candidatus Zambryskibacteria bacterium RIFCSPLOWO2_01_FULL_45_21 TaxID=1802761 RepID=A0A1G2U2Q9_9BACT|nr:MAG: hypothetical protein A2653_01595 [Candidatus Zambryskibacteria bacterium RIFCSPHIGHO2_01_FULL_43_25]OHB03811.1 MAG: hypothetical protein A3B14_03920 [Candidatus Zambryskibacteria bacterium RIFCSPLOWO2_01_FULL_45_21]